MEHQLYHTVLLLAGGINILIAIVLLYNNVWFRNYDVYRRARQLVAICYIIFAIGFFAHAHFCWRTLWPEAASALSVSYFHIGGVLFGWSHTSLMRPDYLTRRVVVRDLLILALGITAYWTAAFLSPSDYGQTLNLSIFGSFNISLFNLSTIIFFLHAIYISYTFYHTYYRVSRNLSDRAADANAPRWWSPEVKRTVLSFHHSFLIGCHLIILFGIGSIAITAAFPNDIWPYTLLLILGILVFTYIFYSLTEYGNVIEAGTNATEDAELKL
jgi:hypothetical protein